MASNRPARLQDHRLRRGGWVRAAVLGANDGVVSIAALVMGVGSASAPKDTVLLAGLAGVAAGALSMAAGEYISVASQRDIEEADVALERRQQLESPSDELAELVGIYEARGLDRELATKVAEQLTARDRLGTHLREELGLRDVLRARPLQAALSGGASFVSLAAIPIGAFWIAPAGLGLVAVASASLAGLAGLGALGAALGGAPRLRGAARVFVGGGLAMAASSLLGKLFGAAGL
jgi:VIT1/CCC1 family predicted Fe2+/Mn2+ transporter